MKGIKLIRLAASAFVLLACTSLSLWAQFTSGIEGIVTDPTGAAVPNATVTIENVGTHITKTIQTSGVGEYRFDLLPASTFTITVSAPGFKTLVQENIRLEVLQTKAVNITLELGAATTQVTVTSAPPPVETSEGRVSSLIGEVPLENMPLVGRNFFSLAVLTPGVTGIPMGAGQTYAQASNDIFNNEFGVGLNAGGLRQELNSFLVDSGSVNGGPRGGVINLTPNADSIQEMRVSVNNFSAEYGRNASAVTNIVTKSGTNAFHGAVGEYFTDDHLTAGNIFQNACIHRYDGSCDRLPVFVRNEGTFAFGGPIWKNHTFFYMTVDMLRSGIGSASETSVASPQFINYLQTNYPNNISTYMETTFAPGAVPQMVQETAGSVAGNGCTGSTLITTEIGQLPCNFPLTYEALLTTTVKRNGLQYEFRIDQQLKKDRFYFTYYHTSKDTPFYQSTYPAFNTVGPEYDQFGNLNYSHTFSPSVLFQSGVSMVEPRGSVNGNNIIPWTTVPGIANYGYSFASVNYINTNGEWKNMLSWNKGSHAFKFGGNYGRDMGWGSGANFGLGATRPQYTFNSLYDFALDKPFSESNYGFNPATGERAGPMFAPLSRRYGLFAEDAWKVKPNLTVTGGLRYEVFPPAIALNAVRKHNPGPALSAILDFNGGDDFQERIANASNVPGPYFYGVLQGLAPRLAIAWDPTGKGNMSVRAGAGRFFDRPSSQGLYHDGGAELPFYATATFAEDTPPELPVYGLCLHQIAPYDCPVNPSIVPGLDSKGGSLGAKSGIDTWNPHPKMPYVVNWFFGIQYSFARNWVLEANYVGSQGHRLLAGYDVNRFDGDLIQNKGVLTRLNTSFGVIDYIQSNGWSSYGGGNVSVRKRWGQGLDFEAAYTFGKALDTSSTYGPNLNNVEATDPNREVALSDFNVAQKLALSFVYQLPGPRGSSLLLKPLRGWQASSVIVLQGGSPYSVYCSLPFNPVFDASGNVVGNTGCDYNADGLDYDRPNTPSFGNFKSGSKQEYLSGIFKASDFPVPGLGQEGNLGRNTFVGPGFADCDLNITKNTKIPWFTSDGATVQFRAEAFNLFNRVNLQNPVSDLGSGAFGLVQSAFPSRNIQFVLKLIF